MQVTDVRIRRAEAPKPDNPLQAYAAVVFDGSFVVHDLRVVRGINGLFVAMPRRKTAEGEFKDTAHPITAEFREHLSKAVLEAYAEHVAQIARNTGT